MPASSRLAAALACALAIIGGGAGAETTRAGGTPSGRVTVRARGADGRPIEDALVRSGALRAATDAGGAARLVLPVGGRVLAVSRPGFAPDTLRLDVRAGMDTTLDIALAGRPVGVEAVVVSTTRAQRRLHDEPERVEVLLAEDIDEKSLMRPGDLALLLAEMNGVRAQTASAASGATGLRIQGLRAQYLDVLVDGLPLLGADATGLGLLQTPPLDLAQAEVIKGAATALYGPAALAGVLNLISRRPPEGPAERAALLNQTGRSGTDAMLWLGRRLAGRQGATLLAGVHRQLATDVDGDGWADLPGYDRGEVRPRWFWNGDGGDWVMATAGLMAEDRVGGAVDAAAPPAPGFRQPVETRRGDGGVVGHWVQGGGVFGFRGTLSGEWQRHDARDPASGAVPYRDARGRIFGEATYARARGPSLWLLGAAFERDAYHDPDLAGLDFAHSTPAVFSHATLALEDWLSASAVARCDVHSRYGTFVSPRLSVLAHAGRSLEARVSAGTGFHAPTPFTEETQAIPLARLAPPAGLGAERARSLSLDLTARRGAVEVNGTLFASEVEHPVTMREIAGDPEARVELVNAAGPARQRGAELFAVYAREPLTVQAAYAYLDATESPPGGGPRREVPRTPRHSAGLDVAWEEEESGTRIGFEVFYVGRQSLADDPYRAASAPYATLGILATRRIGPARMFINAENLTDVRHTRYEPLLLPAPGPGGRVTVDPWAPLAGRVVNAGVRFGF